MACLTNYTFKGISLDCNPVLAGMRNLYLAYFDDVKVNTDDATQTATISAVEGDKPTFYQYQITTNTGGLTSTLTRNDQNGTRYYTNTITAQFLKIEAHKHLEVMAMAAEALVAIVEDNMGQYWIVGADSYASGTAATSQTGTSFDDLNGYTVEISARSAVMPYELKLTEGKTIEEVLNIVKYNETNA